MPEPASGQFVRLPIALPPMLTRSIGYGGGGRYLELSWAPDHRHIWWSDGELGMSGDSEGWRVFAEHPTVRALLAPYNVRDCYALLVDHWEGTISVGLSGDIQRLLLSQPSTLHAAADILGGTDEDFLDVLQARLERGQPRDDEDRQLRGARRAQLGREVARWLDEHPSAD
jgi:hypothetical protein